MGHVMLRCPEWGWSPPITAAPADDSYRMRLFGNADALKKPATVSGAFANIDQIDLRCPITASDIVCLPGFFSGMQSHEDFCQRGMTCALCHAALADSCLLDHQSWFQRHGICDVVEIGRGRHHHLMDLGELRRGAVTPEADRVTQALVPWRNIGIDPEEASEVDLAFGLDRELCEGDPADGALRHIAHGHAGIERCDQVFLG